MHKSAENVITIGIILLFVLYMACGCNGEQPVQQQTEKINAGIVDIEKVLKTHKDWSALEKFDKKLADIETRMKNNSGSSVKEFGEKQTEKMRKAHEKAQAELKAELQKVEASLSYQKSQIEGQFKQDLATAKASAAQLRQSAPPPPNAAALTGDMILLRDRQVSAKRLALQKKAKETIDRERTRLEDELAAYDAQISQENQSQRLNIQLKLQLDITDDERKELQEELLSINQEESKLKAAKKDEMGNKIEAMSNKELAAVEAEVAAYKAQLDKDIKNQVGYNPSSGTSNSSELEQKSKKIESELVAKQKRLETQMASAGASANQKLNQKRAEIEKRLKDLEKTLTEEMKKSHEELTRADMMKMEKLQGEYASIQGERSKLYEAMIDDIKKVVSEVSEKEGINVVFLSYVENISAADLTTKTINAFKEKNKEAK